MSRRLVNDSDFRQVNLDLVLHKDVRNPSLYFDRTVQNAHRQLPRWCSASDVDLLGWCTICGDPLYFVEATTNPNKHGKWLVRLAESADVPAMLVWHDRMDITRGRVIWPVAVDLVGKNAVLKLWMSLRYDHMLIEHGIQGRRYFENFHAPWWG